SSLSRSYPGTACRICSAVSGRLVASRQITRLSSRSGFRRDTRALPSWLCGSHATLTRLPGARAAATLVRMIRWRKGVVTAVRREWTGAVELDVAIGDGEDREHCRALAYPALVGRPEPGDTVLLNTTALALGLGTGGYAMVVAA